MLLCSCTYKWPGLTFLRLKTSAHSNLFQSERKIFVVQWCQLAMHSPDNGHVPDPDSSYAWIIMFWWVWASACHETNMTERWNGIVHKSSLGSDEMDVPRLVIIVTPFLDLHLSFSLAPILQISCNAFTHKKLGVAQGYCWSDCFDSGAVSIIV